MAMYTCIMFKADKRKRDSTSHGRRRGDFSNHVAGGHAQGAKPACTRTAEGQKLSFPI